MFAYTSDTPNRYRYTLIVQIFMLIVQILNPAYSLDICTSMHTLLTAQIHLYFVSTCILCLQKFTHSYMYVYSSDTYPLKV